MKFFYKILIIAFLFAVTLFGSGCASLEKTILVGANPVVQTDAREVIRNKVIESQRNLVQMTNNKDSRQILQLLENQSMSVTPTKDGFKTPTFEEKQEKIKIIALLPSDGQYRVWRNFLENDSFAYFLPKRNAMLFKQEDSFTPAFFGLVVDHEGWHALNFHNHPGAVKPLSPQFITEERDNYEHGGVLLAAIGGEKYGAFLASEVLRISTLVQTTPFGLQFPTRDKEYNKKLDDIFGVAGCAAEKKMRTYFVWTNIVFHYIDANYAGTREQKEDAKSQALLSIYRNELRLGKEMN
jgi:hypothetical protein